MDQPNFNSERAAKKFTLFYETIMKKANSIESFDLRLEYLRKIVRDCEKITEFAELFDDYEIDVNFLKTNTPDVDENFFWLVDDSLDGSESVDKNIIREGAEKYISFEMRKLFKDSPDFKFSGIKKVQMHIEFDSEKFAEMKEGENLEYGEQVKDSIERIKIKSHLSDVVRILEAMGKSGVIELTTKVKQFAQLFFEEKVEQISFEKKYNSAKNRIEKEESSTSSKALVKFAKIFCEEAFKGKEKLLDEIIDHLQKVKKNSIYCLY